MASCFSLCFAVISGTLWGMKLKKTKFKTEVRLIVHLDVKADPLLHIHSWLIAVLRMRSNNLYSPSKVIDIKKNSSGQIFDFPSWNLFRLSYTLDYNMLGFLLGFFVWGYCCCFLQTPVLIYWKAFSVFSVIQKHVFCWMRHCVATRGVTVNSVPVFTMYTGVIRLFSGIIKFSWLKMKNPDSFAWYYIIHNLNLSMVHTLQPKTLEKF